MPLDQITNPTGLQGDYGITTSIHTHDFLFNPGDPNPLLNGQGVIPSIDANGFARVTRSGTTADNRIIGVAVNAPTGGYPGGFVCSIVVDGVAQALFSTSTTAGHYMTAANTVAGAFADTATFTAGSTIGQILQTVTISSGTALVWVYIHKM